MAEIRAFCGLRFSTETLETTEVTQEGQSALARLVSSPYDVLSQDERDSLASQSPYNVVSLTLPESRSDDRSKFIKYARSASLLGEWRREGVLSREEVPSIYRYIQTFNIPGEVELFTRTTFLALLKVEPYENGVVLPHEQTFPKHKEDRLRILEATRTHLESIFGLYEDPDSEVFNLICSAVSDRQFHFVTDDGVSHVFEPISDPEVICQITEKMADRKVWIADGHHRYETALAFREAKGGATEDVRIAEDYLVMAFGSMADPGLVLLPTHRIVQELPAAVQSVFVALDEHFTFEDCTSADISAKLAARGTHAFGVVTSERVAIATPKDFRSILGASSGGGSEALGALDVSILHRIILEQSLSLKGLEKIRYTRSADEAVREVEGGAACSFLMNPPSVDDMKEIALGGEKMPQKSTYYYPKILSGLVMWSLNDFV